MKTEAMPVPYGVIEINVSVDAIRTDRRKTHFPLAYPFVVKPGKRLVISTQGIFFEDEDLPKEVEKYDEQ